MKTTYTVARMTCAGCRASVAENLRSVAGVTGVAVFLDKAEAEVTTKKPIPTENLQKALPEKYSISIQKGKDGFAPSTGLELPAGASSKFQQLKPLFLILGYIAVASVLSNYKNWHAAGAMLDFMGGFFLVFSFFKLLDVKGFAASFSMYDPVAGAWPVYGKIYPFIEVALGLMFLARFKIEIALVLTTVLLSITTVVLANGKKIQCACLGTVLKLPMTVATFIENAIMIVMALVMLFGPV
ncbi:MAG: heavy-metal-associated domain-containing protein [Marinirhabdus sp.]